MTGFFIDLSGCYYEGDRQDESHLAVTQRPSAAYVWQDGAWLPSQEGIVAALTTAVQKHLDDTAKTRNYDSILSLCSYAASAHPKFGPEGQAGVAWRDSVWATCYAIMADVQAGTRAVPTEADLLAALPAMAWPA